MRGALPPAPAGQETLKGRSTTVRDVNVTADRHVLHNGGTPLIQLNRHNRTDASVPDAVEFFVRHNGCHMPPTVERHGNITTSTYAPCKGGSAVVLLAIKGWGHAWPDGKKAPFADEPTREISATDAMWEFFAAHPKVRAARE